MNGKSLIILIGFFLFSALYSQEKPEWYAMLDFVDESRDPSEETYSESQSDIEQGLLQFFNSFSLAQDYDGRPFKEKRNSW